MLKIFFTTNFVIKTDLHNQTLKIEAHNKSVASKVTFNETCIYSAYERKGGFLSVKWYLYSWAVRSSMSSPVMEEWYIFFTESVKLHVSAPHILKKIAGVDYMSTSYNVTLCCPPNMNTLSTTSKQYFLHFFGYTDKFLIL